MHGERECHGVRGAMKEERCSVQSGQEAERERLEGILGVAQWVKHFLCKYEVPSSDPQFPDWLTGQSV